LLGGDSFNCNVFVHHFFENKFSLSSFFGILSTNEIKALLGSHPVPFPKSSVLVSQNLSSLRFILFLANFQAIAVLFLIGIDIFNLFLMLLIIILLFTTNRIYYLLKIE
jgi:hypothetical protein